MLLFGCKTLMPPAAGGYVNSAQATPGSVDMALEGGIESIAMLVDTKKKEPFANGTLRLTPQLTERWSLPLEARSAHPINEPTNFDLTTRIGGRYTFRCEDKPDKCSAEELQRGMTYLFGFGGGPNVRFSEQADGQYAKVYGVQVDFEAGASKRFDWVSLSALTRFAYVYNEATPSAIWSTGTLAVGFHPHPAHVVALGFHFGAGITIDSMKTKTKDKEEDIPLFGLGIQMGAMASWTVRFGSTQPTPKAPPKPKAAPAPIPTAPVTPPANAPDTAAPAATPADAPTKTDPSNDPTA